MFQNPLVQPIITPRFALSCDLNLMEMLGDLARKKNLHIQVKIHTFSFLKFSTPKWLHYFHEL